MLGFVIGGVFGVWKVKIVEMMVMLEMVLLFNGFGGVVLLFLGWVILVGMSLIIFKIESVFIFIILFFIILVGGIMFFGLVVVWGKLLGKMSFKVVIFIGFCELSILYLIGMVVIGYFFIIDLSNLFWIYCVIVLLLSFGLWVIILIGGVDMLVVIVLLNSYLGVVVLVVGFVIGNIILIVIGLLVGVLGLIFINIMCKVMNCLLMNVLLFGFVKLVEVGEKIEGEIKVLLV